MNNLGGWIFGALVAGFFVLVFVGSRPTPCPDEGMCRSIFANVNVEDDDELYCGFQPGRLLREYEVDEPLERALSTILANAAPYTRGAPWESRRNLQFDATEYILRLQGGGAVHQIALIGPNNEDDDSTVCLNVLD